MRILVTGAAGVIGRPTCQALLDAGHEVRATDRIWGDGVPVKLQIADLCDLPSVYRLLDDIDAVAHFGNYKSDRDPNIENTYHNNVIANANLFNAAGQVGVKRIVYASTIQVVSGLAPGAPERGVCTLPYLPLDQNLPINAQNPYALGKVASEQMLEWCCRTFDIVGVALRYPWVPTTEHLQRYLGRSPRRSDEMPRGRKLNEGLSYLHVDDAVDLAVRCLTESSLSGYRHYLVAAPDTGYGVTPQDALERWYTDTPLRPDVSELQTLFDISQVTAETGWRPEPRLTVMTEAESQTA